MIDKKLVLNPVAGFFNRFSVRGHWWARILYILGFQYSVSSCIADFTTYGYGKLDFNGFWQFPLYFRDDSGCEREDIKFAYHSIHVMYEELRNDGYDIEDAKRIILDETLNFIDTHDIDND